MITIDIDKCYGCKKCLDIEPGLFSLIEEGIRAAVCRHCVNPPCVSACPEEALEKPAEGDLIRHKMKCVSCKQCANACPVGANPAEILRYRNYPGIRVDIDRCRKNCPLEAVGEADSVPQGWNIIDGRFAVKAKDWK